VTTVINDNRAEVMAQYSPEDGAPAAWVGCLACYNNGALVGAWVDGAAAADAKEDADWVLAVHRNAPDALAHEEWQVFDHENYAGAIRGECSPETAQEAAEFLAQIEEGEAEALAAFIRAFGGSYKMDAETLETHRDAYRGFWSSFEEYAEEFAEECGLINADAQWPHTCIDWEHAARELSYDYVTEDVAGGVHVWESF